MARILSFEVVGGKAVLGGREVTEGEVVRCGLGSFEFRDGRITRWSNSGAGQYSTPLRPDGQWKAGPAYAHRVKPVEEERDPIKRILREFGVAFSDVVYEREGSKIVELTSHREPCFESWTGVEYTVEAERSEWAEGGTCRHSDVACYVAQFNRRADCGYPTRSSFRYYIFPDCTPPQLGDLLSRRRLGDWADYAFFRGQDDPEFAAAWLAAQGYTFTPKPHEGWGEPEPLVTARPAKMGGGLIDETFTIEGEPVEPWARLSPLATLVQKHGVGLIAGQFEEARAYFARYASFEHALTAGEFVVEDSRLVEGDFDKGWHFNRQSCHEMDYGVESHSHLGEVVAFQRIDLRAGEETARIDVVIWKSGEAYRGNVYIDQNGKDFPRDGLRRALGIESRKALYAELLKLTELDVELTPVR